MARRPLVLGACMLLAALPALAGDGHFLHGIGAVNSSLGGAGAGMAFDPIGALWANPALLTQLHGTDVEISAEIFGDDLSATTSPGGGPAHTVNSNGQIGVLPALGWSIHQPDKDYAFGFGLLAVAGFRTNYPADPQSLLTAPTSPLTVPPSPPAVPSGFGRLATYLAITKIPLATAWQVTPQLSLGLALNVYQGALVIQPLPVVQPDCDINGMPASPSSIDRNLRCYRPSTSGQVASYTAMVQAGAFYQVNPVWSLGASFTPRQSFPEYRWNSAFADPNLPNFGQPKKVGIVIDGPQIGRAHV